MPDKPAAEIAITEPLVRALVAGQASTIADAASLPLSHTADGWDCSVWRLGDSLAVRLPRRAVAAPLVLHEHAVLSEFARRLSNCTVGVPAPIVCGRPGSGYPWSWSIVPWFEGSAGYLVPRAERSEWAVPLANALRLLHAPAPAKYPLNPMRGVPLAARADSVALRIAGLRGRLDHDVLDGVVSLWQAGLAAPPWSGPPLWIHGDLHPGNLIARGSEPVAIIDFGDVTAGDPAYDLAIAWLAFNRDGRAAFMEALDHDDSTWTRAHGWAAAVALILVDQSDDNPEYSQLGHEVLAELLLG